MPNKEPIPLRPGKTIKDKKSGAWANHLVNKANKAQYNRQHKSRVSEKVYKDMKN